MTDLVSVCLPTYNGAAWLAETLASVQRQTHDRLEVVVADDGSTDGSVELVRDVVRDRPLRVLPGVGRLGLAGNLDRAMAAADGAWMKPVFQDDLLDDGCVATMLAAGRHGPFVLSARRYRYEPGVPAERVAACQDLVDGSVHGRFPGRRHVAAVEVRDLVCEVPDVNIFGEPVSWLVRRDLARGPGLDPRLVQMLDLEWLVRHAVRHGLALVHEPLVDFRVHADSETHRNYSTRWYRTEILDRLVLRLLYAAGPAYAPLREAAEQHRPRVDWAEQARAHAGHALRLAVRDARHGRSGPLREWFRVIEGDRQLRRAVDLRPIRRQLVVEVGQRARESARRWRT